MSEVKTSPKKPRSVYSRSRKFEAGYVKFMADVFEKNIQSIATFETSDDKMLVLAGTRRLRLNKKTGLLHSEDLTPASQSTSESWRAGSALIPSFWASSTEMANALKHAWSRRVAWFVPPAEVCYPKPLSTNSGYLIPAENRWQMALDRAASRRLGGRGVQLRLVKRFIAQLWNFLADREVLKLCHAYFGRKASLAEYNYTVRRRADLEARFAETPNLAPLIGTFINTLSRLKSGKYRIPLDVLAQARAHHFAPPKNHEALTPAGWRYFANLSPTTVATLWQAAGRDTQQPGQELIPLLNLVSKTGEQPPLTFLKYLLRDLRSLRYPLSREAYAAAQDSLTRFVRLAAQQARVAKRKNRLKRFLSEDFVLALDWLKQREGRYYDNYHEPTPPIATVPKNATWASIMRAQHDWHAQREERERLRREADAQAHREYVAKRDAITWTSALAACEVQGATVTPLVTGKDLREEGERMKHCVGSYVDYCSMGTSRIFAIKLENKEATLELHNEGSNRWKIRQVFGPKNTEVSKRIRAIAKTLVPMYKAAAKEHRKVP